MSEIKPTSSHSRRSSESYGTEGTLSITSNSSSSNLGGSSFENSPLNSPPVSSAQSTPLTAIEEISGAEKEDFPKSTGSEFLGDMGGMTVASADPLMSSLSAARRPASVGYSFSSYSLSQRLASVGASSFYELSQGKGGKGGKIIVQGGGSPRKTVITYMGRPSSYGDLKASFGRSSRGSSISGSLVDQLNTFKSPDQLAQFFLIEDEGEFQEKWKNLLGKMPQQDIWNILIKKMEQAFGLFISSQQQYNDLQSKACTSFFEVPLEAVPREVQTTDLARSRSSSLRGEEQQGRSFSNSVPSSPRFSRISQPAEEILEEIQRKFLSVFNNFSQFIAGLPKSEELSVIGCRQGISLYLGAMSYYDQSLQIVRQQRGDLYGNLGDLYVLLGSLKGEEKEPCAFFYAKMLKLVTKVRSLLPKTSEKTSPLWTISSRKWIEFALVRCREAHLFRKEESPDPSQAIQLIKAAEICFLLAKEQFVFEEEIKKLPTNKKISVSFKKGEDDYPKHLERLIQEVPIKLQGEGHRLKALYFLEKVYSSNKEPQAKEKVVDQLTKALIAYKSFSEQVQQGEEITDFSNLEVLFMEQGKGHDLCLSAEKILFPPKKWSQSVREKAVTLTRTLSFGGRTRSHSSPDSSSQKGVDSKVSIKSSFLSRITSRGWGVNRSDTAVTQFETENPMPPKQFEVSLRAGHYPTPPIAKEAYQLYTQINTREKLQRWLLVLNNEHNNLVKLTALEENLTAYVSTVKGTIDNLEELQRQQEDPDFMTAEDSRSTVTQVDRKVARAACKMKGVSLIEETDEEPFDLLDELLPLQKKCQKIEAAFLGKISLLKSGEGFQEGEEITLQKELLHLFLAGSFNTLLVLHYVRGNSEEEVLKKLYTSLANEHERAAQFFFSLERQTGFQPLDILYQFFEMLHPGASQREGGDLLETKFFDPESLSMKIVHTFEKLLEANQEGHDIKARHLNSALEDLKEADSLEKEISEVELLTQKSQLYQWKKELLAIYLDKATADELGISKAVSQLGQASVDYIDLIEKLEDDLNSSFQKKDFELRDNLKTKLENARFLAKEAKKIIEKNIKKS